MKVLQLCKKSPIPPKDGESLAIHQITKAFTAHNFQVDIACMLTQKHSEFDASFRLKNVQYFPVKINTQTTITGVLSNFFQPEPYIVKRFYSIEFENKIVALLTNNTYDYVILEGVFLGLYVDVIKKCTQAKIILRAHNIEHQIWERVAKNEQNLLKKAYLKVVMNAKFKAFETKIAQKVDAVLSISPVDEAYIRKITKKPVLTIPMTVETQATAFLPAKFSVGFIGGMDWQPNLQGIKWFVKEVWQNFAEKNSNAEFHIAGRNFPENEQVFKSKGVVVYGEVEDATAFINQMQIIVAPIFSGSGMRVKIIEAMNLGRCVISTTVGAEGIAYTNNKNIVIADTQKEWIQALETLIDNKNKVETVAANAKLLVAEKYNQDEYAETIIKFVKEL